MTYRVKNWTKYQHYKKRCPPWIKLHYETMTSSDWVMLDDSSRVLAIACMLVASRHDGEVPSDPAYIKRVAYLNQEPDFKPLISCGFLEPCKQMLADDSATQADACSETETEKRQRRDREREARTRDRIENDIVGKDPDLRAVQNAPDFSVVEMMSGKHKMVGTRILEHWPQYEPAHVPETVKDFMYYVGDFEPHDLNELLLDASKRWSKDRPLYDGRGNRLHPYLVSTAQIASRSPKNGNGTQGIPYKETAAEAQVRRNHEVLDEWLREKEGNHGR